MDKKTIYLFLVSALLLPRFILADIEIPSVPSGDFNLTEFMSAVFNFIWPVFIGLSILMFLYSGFMFLSANGDSGKVASARRSVLWGIAGVAIAILAFSIPAIISTVVTGSNSFTTP